MQTKTINQKIDGTNLYIFSKDAETGLFTYSRPLLIDESRQVAESVNRVIETDYRGVSGLRQGLKVAENGSLYNMNTLKGILANRTLMEQTSGNVRFLTIQEGLLLHGAQLLPSGELTDFGIALYNDGCPDEEIAKSLNAEAKTRGYSLPVLASFRALGLKLGGQRYGVVPTFVSEEGVVTKKSAQDTLNRFSYVGNSGVRRLVRDSTDIWFALWGDYLDHFDEYCRVGRVSAEGSAKNLKELVDSQIKERYTKSRTELESKISELTDQVTGITAQEQECIASAEKMIA